MKTILLVLATILINFTAISCKAQKSESSDVKTDGSDFVVFEYNSDNYSHPFKNAKPTTLSADEIADVKALVKEAVKKTTPNRNTPPTLLNSMNINFSLFPSSTKTTKEKFG